MACMQTLPGRCNKGFGDDDLPDQRNRSSVNRVVVSWRIADLIGALNLWQHVIQADT